jgi:chorismate-pyruvate lyase
VSRETAWPTRRWWEGNYIPVHGGSRAIQASDVRHPRRADGRFWLPLGRSGRLTRLDPAELRRAVLDSPGTVTDFLEMLTGEPLVADVVLQSPVVLGPDNELEATAGHAATHRIAVLKGGTTDRPYVYAETVFMAGRLPEPARAQLEGTNQPIGRVLVAHGIHPDRESLSTPGGAGAPVPLTVAGLGSDPVWSRAYRLTIGGQPVFAIHEWFLRPVLDAYGHQLRG